MLGRPPKLDVASLQSKIIARKRGGYCFEQNMLFRAGLRSLGYRITSLQGRVVRGLEINAPRPAIHMLLQVELPEGVYLADVGFGNLAPTSAILLAPQIEQETPHELMRFIDVGGELTLQARLKQAGSTSTGSSPILHFYLNRVQSSRRLEREAGRNLEVMWLTGRLAPDHKTIADFRKDNGAAIRKVCAQFVELCRKMGLLTKASVAIDGSKFKAVNSRDNNFTQGKIQRRQKQIEESVARYMSQLDTADRQTAAGEEPSETVLLTKTRLREKLAKLERRSETAGRD
jgi:hypothetical protein